MAKQKRLNKNLVAFLTVMGMLLVLSVFALILQQQTQRDAATLAEMAARRAAAGDLLQASRFYKEAYRVSARAGEADVAYLAKQADCLLELGELGVWNGELTTANAQRPNDPNILRIHLAGLWRLQWISRQVWYPAKWREVGEKLRRLDPQDGQAAAAMAQGLWQDPDPSQHSEGDELAREAYELAPQDPRVAQTYLRYLQRQAPAGQMLGPEALAKVLVALEPAVTAHPDDVQIVATYVDLLRFLRNQAREAGDTEEADAHLKAAVASLEAARTAHTDADGQLTSPELAFSMAVVSRDALLQRWADRIMEGPALTPEEMTAVQSEVGVIDQLLQRAIALAPAFYDAWNLRAEMTRFRFNADGTRVSPDAVAEAMLGVYREAQRTTETLRTLRAVIQADQRLRLLRRAFELALQRREVQTEEAARATAMREAKNFLDDAAVKYPQHPLTHYMRGQYLTFERNNKAAILAFEEARQTASAANIDNAGFWLETAGVPRLPSEELASRYYEEGQLGKVVEFGQQARQQYEQARLEPPVPFMLMLAQARLQLNQPEEALQLLRVVQAAAERGGQREGWERLALLARTALGTAAPREGEADTPSMRLYMAQVAARSNQVDQALKLYQHVLNDGNSSDEEFVVAAQQATALLTNADEALRLADELLAKDERPAVRPSLALLRWGLRHREPGRLQGAELAAAEAELNDVLALIEDPLRREQTAYNVYRQFDAERALEILGRLQQQAGTVDMGLLDQEFRLRLTLFERHGRVADEQRAEALAAQLATHGDRRGWDQAGGATYRGQLALARGKFDDAIREFRQAQRALPASDELALLLSRALLGANRAREATETLEGALAASPQNVDIADLLQRAYDSMAGAALGADKTQYERRAREIRTQVRRINPNHPRVLGWAQRERELSDPLAALAERERRLAQDPGNLGDLLRVAALYSTAWDQLYARLDTLPPAAAELRTRGDAFFATELARVPAEGLVPLVQEAVNFHFVTGQAPQAEALLRRLMTEQHGVAVLQLQVLLAKLYALQDNEAAAEREYLAAQQAIATHASDPNEAGQLELFVGRELIEHYRSIGRLNKVIDACRWVLERTSGRGVNPNEIATVRGRLVDALLRDGRLAEAEQDLADLLRESPDNLAGLGFKAQIEIQRGARDAALATLERILEIDSQNGWAFFTRGRLFRDLAQFDEARRELERAAELAVRTPELAPVVHETLAELYERAVELDRAESQWMAMLDAIEKLPTATTLMRQAAVQRIVRFLYQTRRDFERAQRLISEAMARNPNDALWPFELGRLFEERARSANTPAARATEDYNSAAGYYRQAADRIFTMPAELAMEEARIAGARGASLQLAASAMLAQMNALTRAGRPRDTLAQLQVLAAEAEGLRGDKPDSLLFELDALLQRLPASLRAQISTNMRAQVAVDWSARLLVERAKAEGTLGNADGARRAWAAAVATAGRLELGLLGEVISAVKEALPAAEVDGVLAAAAQMDGLAPIGVDRVQTMRGQFALDRGEPEEALGLLRPVLEKLPPDSAEHQAALLTAALAYERLGDVAATRAAYEQVLAQNANHPVALNNLAFLLVTAEPPNQALAEALEYAERLRTRVGASAATATMLDTIGWVYFKNNRMQEALTLLEDARRLGGVSVDVNRRLGYVYEALRRPVDARRVWSEAVERARASNDAAKVRELEDLIQKLP